MKLVNRSIIQCDGKVSSNTNYNSTSDYGTNYLKTVQSTSTRYSLNSKLEAKNINKINLSPFRPTEPNNNKVDNLKLRKLNLKHKKSTIMDAASPSEQEEIKTANVHRKLSIQLLQTFSNPNEEKSNKCDFLKNLTKTVYNQNFQTLHNKNSLSDGFLSSAEENNDVYIVKKLSIWDTENLDFREENYNKLYKELSTLYKKDGNVKKICELKNARQLLQSIGGINQNIEKLEIGLKNKALEKYLENKKKEENVLLLNSIAKTARRYGKKNGLLLKKENQFGIKLLNINDTEDKDNLNNDSNKVIEDFTDDFGGGVIYHKLINEKGRQETNMKNDIMEIGKQIFLKREEKERLVKEINDSYEKIRKYDEVYNKKMSIIENEILHFQDEFEKMQKKLKLAGADKDTIFNNNVNQLNYGKEIESRKHQLIKERENLIDSTEKRKSIIMYRLKVNNDEINYLKNVYHLMAKEAKNYYFGILKSGYDVRYEGLVWVVKRLLELNSILEYKDFPKFLSHEQIDYLIMMGKLSLEENLMNLILSTLKKKLTEMRMNKNNMKFEKLNEFINNNNNLENSENGNKSRRRLSSINSISDQENIINFSTTHKKIKSKFYITNKKQEFDDINSRLIYMFSNIRDKYKEAFKYSEDKKIDEENLNKIIYEIKKSLMANGNYTDDKNSEVILKFFNDNADYKFDFQTIFVLRRKIQENHIYREKLKKEMVDKLKETEKIIRKNSNPHLSLRHELIFSAMFGSNVSI